MVKTASSKFAFNVPEGKILFSDMPFNIASVRGGEKEKTEISTPMVMEVVDVIDIASIYRIPLDQEKFLDVLFVYPDEYKLLAVGVEDKERGDNEPFYIKNLNLQNIETFTIEDGLSEETVSSDVEELKADSELLTELTEVAGKELVEKVLEGNIDAVREVAKLMKPREFRLFFPSIYKKVKTENGFDIGKIRPAEKLTEEKIKEMYREGKAKKLSLNSLIVGATPEGTLIYFAPERLKTISSLAVAKMLHSSNKDFRLLNYLSNIYKPKDVEKTVSKIQEYMKDASEFNRKLGERAIKELKTEGVISKETRDEAFNRKRDEIKDFLKREGGIIVDPNKILKRKKGGYFLANTITNYGIPLEDFSKFQRLLLITIPRPVQVENEWRVETGIKPTGGMFYNPETEKWKIQAFQKIDSYTLMFDRLIYLNLKEMLKEETTMQQVKKLMVDGYGRVSGLDVIKDFVSQYKNASMIYGKLVDYIKNKLLKVVSDENAEKEDVVKAIQSDRFLSEYIERMETYFLEKTYKLYNLKKFSPNPSKLVQTLLKEKILEKTPEGYVKVNLAAIEKKKDRFSNLLYDPDAYKRVVFAVRNTLRGTDYLQSAQIPDSTLEEAIQIAKHFRKQLDFSYEEKLKPEETAAQVNVKEPAEKPAVSEVTDVKSTVETTEYKDSEKPTVSIPSTEAPAETELKTGEKTKTAIIEPMKIIEEEAKNTSVESGIDDDVDLDEIKDKIEKVASGKEEYDINDFSL